MPPNPRLEPYKRALRRALAGLGVTAPFVSKLQKGIVEVGPAKSDAKYTLLALKPERFRKELDLLAARPEFRVLYLKQKSWHKKMLELYWETTGVDLAQYNHAKEGSPTHRARRKIRVLLRRVLKKLFEQNGVDALLGAAVHYTDCGDFGAVATEIGRPYIVLHRECFNTSQGQYERVVNLCTMLKRFEGDRIIVYNEVTKRPMVDSGFAREDEVAVLGAMRMDAWVKRLTSKEPRSEDQPRRATLFSFVPCAGLGGICNAFPEGWDKGYIRLFEETHAAFARAALERPGDRFLIKPKWGGDWYEHIDRALAKHGLDRAAIPNLTVDADLDAQDVVMDSDVIVSFGSTLLLEGGIAGVPVITPHFAEATAERYQKYVMLKDELDLFDVAESGEEVTRLVLDRMDDPRVDPEVLEKRRQAFERYLSPLDARAGERYARTIAERIEAARATRSA